MKKFASLFLALALCMGLAVPAFAAEESTIYLNISEDQTGEISYNTVETTDANPSVFSITGKTWNLLVPLIITGTAR